MESIDIPNQEFATKLRGYDQNQVDEFMKDIDVKLANILEENKALKEQNTVLSQRLREYTKKHDELNQAVIETQDQADKIIEDAHHGADEIIKSAAREADFINEESEKNANLLLSRSAQKAKEIHQEISTLRQQSLAFKEALLNLTQDHLKEIQDPKWDDLLMSSQVNELSDQVRQELRDTQENIEEE